MFWLTYIDTDQGRHILRIVEAPEKPDEIRVINHGFKSPTDALSVMAYYLKIDEAGFIRVNDLISNHPLTVHERFVLAFHIEPMVVLFLASNIVLSICTLLILLLHMG